MGMWSICSSFLNRRGAPNVSQYYFDTAITVDLRFHDLYRIIKVDLDVDGLRGSGLLC